MVQDGDDDGRIGDEGDDPHEAATRGAEQRQHLVDASQKDGPPNTSGVGGTRRFGTLHLEPGVSATTIEALKQMGHRVEVVTNGVTFGGYQAIYRNPDTGIYSGATEMRKDGLAIGY